MNKNTKLIGIILIVLLVVAGGVGLYYSSTQKVTEPVNVMQTTKADEKITFSNEGKEVVYTGEDGKTALELLKSLTTVDSKESAYGTMVTGIRDVKADEKKSYWAFYVDGAYASEGAGTYKTKASETITWKLEAINQ